jgi:hypothetical protein
MMGKSQYISTLNIECNFFITFILFKPYLLIMYDVCQTIQLINCTSQTCFKKDISLVKLINPSMLDEDLIDRIIRFNIPKKLFNSPNWNYSQLCDLMAMVDNLGLPHLFLTLTLDKSFEFSYGMT